MNKPSVSFRTLYFINSLTYIVLSYISVFILVNFLQGLFAGFYDIPSIISRQGIQFLADSQDWWYDSVIVVFTSKIFLLFLISVLFFAVYIKSSIYKSYLKLFFLWGSFIAFSWMTGEILYGSLLGQGIHHALAWLYIKDTGKLFIIVLSLILYASAALVFSKAFIFSGNIYLDHYDENSFKDLYLFHILLPYMAALGIITLLKLPDFPIIELPSLYSAIFTIGIMLFNTGQHARLFRQDEKPPPIFLDHKAIITALFLAAAYFVFLENGIHL